MTNALGTRAVFSILLPATNAMVEPDMAMLQPKGVTNQSYRFPFHSLPDNIERLLDMIEPALDMALACEPDRVIIGYSPEYRANNVNDLFLMWLAP